MVSGIEFIPLAFLLAILLDQLADKDWEDHLGFSVVYALVAMVFTVFTGVFFNAAQFGSALVGSFSTLAGILVMYWLGLLTSRAEKGI